MIFENVLEEWAQPEAWTPNCTSAMCTLCLELLLDFAKLLIVSSHACVPIVKLVFVSSYNPKPIATELFILLHKFVQIAEVLIINKVVKVRVTKKN
jgi:hypothetical protein